MSKKTKKARQKKKQAKKAPVYIWTGIGYGKTSSALGIALRMTGHGKKAVVVQFMKGWKNIGEYKIQKRLSPEYEIHQFGRKGWVKLKKPSKKDKKLAAKGLKFAENVLKKKPDLLVLDEIILAVAIGLLNVKEVIKVLDKAPSKTALYLTGRFCPQELIERADYVTEFVTLKQPKKIVAKKGIEY